MFVGGPFSRKAAAIDQGRTALNEATFGCRFLDRQRDVQSAAEVDVPNFASALLGAMNRRNRRQMEEMGRMIFGDDATDLRGGGDVEDDRPDSGNIIGFARPVDGRNHFGIGRQRRCKRRHQITADESKAAGHQDTT